MRRNEIRDTLVAIAEGRASRPRDLISDDASDAPAICPFCPGNEHMTPPEAFAIYTEGGEVAPGSGCRSARWLVRVFANRYPAFGGALHSNSSAPSRGENCPGYGAHEVVVDSPNHDETGGSMGANQVRLVLLALRERLKFHYRSGARYVLAFKNSGLGSGASLSHPHWQVVAMPVVPPRVELELERAMRHFAATGRCLYCDFMRRETGRPELVVYENRDFAAVCPEAPILAWHMMVYPKSHSPFFPFESDVRFASLADAVRRSLVALESALDKPPYNVIIHSAPIASDPLAEDAYHWYMEILPRVTTVGGFEWGTGCFINHMPPERSAEILRRHLPG